MTASRSCSSSAKRPSARDRGLLARLPRDASCARALRGDVADVGVEPAVAAPAGDVDRVDRRPDDLAVRAHVALDEVSARAGPGQRAIDDRPARADVVRVRHLGRASGRRSSSRLRPSIRQSASLTSSQRQSLADDRHPHGRVGEAAPEAVLARPAQGGDVAREEAERDAAGHDHEPAAGQRVGDHRVGLALRQDDQHVAVATAIVTSSARRGAAAGAERVRAPGRRRRARTRSPGRPGEDRAAMISDARDQHDASIARREARSKRPASSSPASTQVAEHEPTTGAVAHLVGVGQRDPDSTIAAPPAISHPMARAMARRRRPTAPPSAERYRRAAGLG